jgi:uncharacterized protein
MKVDVDYRVIDLESDRGLLFLTGNHRSFFVKHQLAERLRHGFDELTPAERDEWERLTTLGLVSGENADVLRHSTFEDGADLALNINLTSICNLACTYCFADGGDYGRMTGAMGHSSVDDIFDFIDQHTTSSHSVRLEFFGGEPLANYPVMREICERSELYAKQRGTSFVYRISTNLTLLPHGVLDLFSDHRFIVSVSIDGCREVQDTNRPAKGGQGSYDRVMKNVRLVRQASDEITLVARMTVAQRRPTLLDNVRELWRLNIFDYFQIYPGVFPVADKSEDNAADPGTSTAGPVLVQITRMPGTEGADLLAPAASGCGSGARQSGRRQRHVNFFLQEGMVEQFCNFLAAYPTLFSAGNRFKGVLEYERTVQMAVEGRLALAFCSGGRTYFTHSPDRTISPCHRLVGEPDFDVGHGAEGLTRVPEDWRLPVDRHPVCGQCWARYLCGGGCKQENYVASGDINVLNDESCRYQLLLAEEVLRMMGRSAEDYLRRNRNQLADLFVSCGRPVIENGRTGVDARAENDFVHFVPLTVQG